MGKRNTAPILLRTTFGLNASTHPVPNTTPSTPLAAAERNNVPKLPGSRMASNNNNKEGWAGHAKLGWGTTASTPAGVSVSAIWCNNAVSTSSGRCPHWPMSLWWAGLASQSAVAKNMVGATAAATNSFTQRVPSTTNTPSRWRNRRSACKRRTYFNLSLLALVIMGYFHSHHLVIGVFV